ncbi:MAG: acyl-CoA carboxylase subunit beta, partial [Actinobacteria bacterium]|nr:acyl-CoA carboxylase subunit beta [Actinomycetota bacterium]
MTTPEIDPRDPQLRLARLLDPGTVQLISPVDKSGMLAATGLIKGNRVVVFASDATFQGGALGVDGAQVILTAYREAMATQLP